MKEIAVISGKGGTGKSSIAAALTSLDYNKIVLADCDVEAANMHLLFSPTVLKFEEFKSGNTFEINQNKCWQCSQCIDVCRFNAVKFKEKSFHIDQINCEACGYCYQVCPQNAIVKTERNTGFSYISKSKFNNYLIHAKLNVAAENSGKLVSHIRQNARHIAEKNSIPYILIDGSPGIACPVIASLTGVNFVLLVTEPSVSGFHDLKRVYNLIQPFNIKVACIINKSDINIHLTDKITAFLNENNIELLCKIPYNKIFTDAMKAGKTIIEYDSDNKINKSISNSWDRIKEILN